MWEYFKHFEYNCKKHSELVKAAMERLSLDELQQSGLLRKKACDALRRKGIPDLSAMQYWTRDDLLRVDGIGEATVKRIEEILRTRDLRFRIADAWDWRRTASDPNKAERTRTAATSKLGTATMSATALYLTRRRSSLPRPITALLIAFSGIPLGFVLGLSILLLMHGWYFVGALIEGGGDMYAARFWYEMWTEEAGAWDTLSLSTFLIGPFFSIITAIGHLLGATD